MKSILETVSLNKHYGKGEGLVKAIDDTNIKIKEGEFVAIVGKSGSGKSTLLHMLGALDRPTSGKVLIDNNDISNMKEEQFAVFRRRKIGFIFQYYNLIPSVNVWENIVLPVGLDGRKVDFEFTNDILKTLGLDSKKKNMPNTLSGGQQQRVAIARTLAANSPVILADEPTGNLDSDTEDEIIEILKKNAHQQGKCVIVVTHSKELAKKSDVILELKDKKLTY